MKYITIDTNTATDSHDIYTTEHATAEDAIKAAKKAWSYLTASEQRTRRISVIESVNPDEDAEDHLDGNEIWSSDAEKAMFKIQDTQTGTMIDTYATYDEAKAALEAFEASDKAEGIYEEGFYEVRPAQDIPVCTIEGNNGPCTIIWSADDLRLWAVLEDGTMEDCESPDLYTPEEVADECHARWSHGWYLTWCDEWTA